MRRAISKLKGTAENDEEVEGAASNSSLLTPCAPARGKRGKNFTEDEKAFMATMYSDFMTILENPDTHTEANLHKTKVYTQIATDLNAQWFNGRTYNDVAKAISNMKQTVRKLPQFSQTNPTGGGEALTPPPHQWQRVMLDVMRDSAARPLEEGIESLMDDDDLATALSRDAQSLNNALESEVGAIRNLPMRNESDVDDESSCFDGSGACLAPLDDSTRPKSTCAVPIRTPASHAIPLFRVDRSFSPLSAQQPSISRASNSTSSALAQSYTSSATASKRVEKTVSPMAPSRGAKAATAIATPRMASASVVTAVPPNGESGPPLRSRAVSLNSGGLQMTTNHAQVKKNKRSRKTNGSDSESDYETAQRKLIDAEVTRASVHIEKIRKDKEKLDVELEVLRATLELLQVKKHNAELKRIILDDEIGKRGLRNNLER